MTTQGQRYSTMGGKNKSLELIKSLLTKQYGAELADKIISGYFVNRKPSLRINPLKGERETALSELKSAGIELTPAGWYEDGFVIENADESAIQALKAYTEGRVYLQSLSSMLPPILMNPKIGTDILDMAAAPGSKTTQIAAITKNNCRITACEMNHIRAERLRHNVSLLGANGVYVMETDSRRLDSAFSFDSVLLDAPCSGSGTLHFNEETSQENSGFTEELISKCVRSQKALIAKAISLLKPGREMIYSTCSILSRENEDIVSWALSGGGVEIVPLRKDWLDTLPRLPVRIDGTLCVMPNEHYEGFFIAKLKKVGKSNLKIQESKPKGRRRH